MKISSYNSGYFIFISLFLSIALSFIFLACPTEPVDPDPVSINKNILLLVKNQEETLIAAVWPSEAEEQTLIWTSSNGAIATVDGVGKVKGVDYGSATITVTREDGESANCEVHVGPVIYSVGYDWNENDGMKSICYFKGTTRINLTIPSGIYIPQYISIAVAPDNTVYTALCYATIDSDMLSCYWKDNVYTPIDNPVSNDLRVSVITIGPGNELYTAGSHHPNGAFYWTNSTFTVLEPPPGGGMADWVYAITLGADNTVYTAGECRDSSYISHACYWTDTVCTPLNIPAEPGIATGENQRPGADAIILGSDNTVYTAGYYWDNKSPMRSIACYWEGTNCITLDRPSAFTFSGGDAIALGPDNTVYTSGGWVTSDYNSRACYWKGKTRMDLHPAGASYSFTYDIAVINGSVYVAGGYGKNGSETRLCYWKDGVLFDLGAMNTGPISLGKSVMVFE